MSNRHQLRRSGFTLAELMVVIIILGALAMIVGPRYFKTIEVSKSDEAQVLLQSVYAANRMYVMNNCALAVNCYQTTTNISVLVSNDYILDFNT
ncbi:MAG: prepilin-type N-terminal cleavage/methylation domain-containing protein, partial [Elusimicrobiota bacterium]